MQTKKAIGNLLNRYRAVLKKCHLLNTFGTLALASALMAAGAGPALAASWEWVNKSVEGSYSSWAATTENTTIVNGKIEGNTLNSIAEGGVIGLIYFAGYGKDSGTAVTITDSSFKNNTISAKYCVSAGGIMNKGMTIDLNNVEFSGNKISSDGYSNGGAIYADAAINNAVGVKEGILNFNVTKDMIYSGNTVEGKASTWEDTYGAVAAPVSGGFLYLDRNSTANFNIADGATLTIGAEDASGHMDSIASSLSLDESAKVKSSTLAKKGGGTLTINSQLNDFYGMWLSRKAP